jgi:hypothetical protein
MSKKGTKGTNKGIGRTTLRRSIRRANIFEPETASLISKLDVPPKPGIMID